VASRRRGAGLSLRIIAGAAGALIAGLLCFAGALERWELRTQDWRLQARGPRRTSARIVLAEIRPSTLDAWSDPMHAWGIHLAAAITQARAGGARWIGLDLIPAITGGKPEDRALFTALRQAEGHVVLATAIPPGSDPILPLRPLLYAHPEQGASLGFIDVPPGADDVVRRAPAYLRDGDRRLPSFSATLALRARGHSPVDPHALESLPGVRENADGLASFWINYVGPPGAFPTLAVEDLADPKARRLTPGQKQALSGAILLIGPAYPGDNDIHRGPGADNYYRGVEIHAHALATLLDGRPLLPASRLRESLITVAIGALVALPAALLPFGWGVLWAVVVAAGWYAAAQRAFATDALWPVSYPLSAVGLAWLGQTGARTVLEARRRRAVEAMFGQHVSRAVVDRLLRDPDAAALGGERRSMTILFSDIRGFTTRSEEMPPEAVVAQLNEYLGAMADCVFQTEGTLDKYIGDGLMAFWNSPLDQPDHARRAVAAAWAMLQALDPLNARWRAEGRPTLGIGIGLNTGEVLVGNLGSQKRLNYTVIGHVVNLASRIESANKELKTSLLLGETTFEQVRAHVRVRPHTVAVKGVRGPVRVYEVLDFTDGTIAEAPESPSPEPAVLLRTPDAGTHEEERP
jgi:adenylate cyclase